MTLEKINEMTGRELENKNFNKDNSSFEEWYEAIQHYTEMISSDWNREMVTNLGEEVWRELYEKSYGIRIAFIEAFSN